jgi:hypothetical protein
MTGSEILPHTVAIAASVARIDAAADVAALTSCAADAHGLSVALHREEAGAALVTGVLSRLNDFDRRGLLEGLRQARTMQQILKSRYHIET